MRTANVDGFKFPWPFPRQTTLWYKWKSRMTMTFVYLCAKVMFLGGNRLIVRNRQTLLKLIEDRSRSLLTISNHRCNVDDPLIWASVPISNFFANIDRFRYTPTAHNICFTKALHTSLFSLGRCVPIVRGAGVFQECMDFCIEKLNEKQWVHLYPEGKVTSEPLRFKWGIGRLISESKEPPMILPIWVKDMNAVWPVHAPYYPIFGKTVEVIVGQPVDSRQILASLNSVTEIERRKEITDYVQDVLFGLGGCKDLVSNYWCQVMMGESSPSSSKVTATTVDHQPCSSNISTSNNSVIAVGNETSRYPSSVTFTVVSSDTSASDRLSTDAPLSDEHLTMFMRFMDYCFRNVGYFLADHAKLVLTIVLIFTTITSLKIPFTKQQDDLKTGYTPNGARSHIEVAMYEDFYAKQGSEPVGVVVFITAKDNGSLARVEHLNATVDLMETVARNFFIKDMNFNQFCSDFCEFNEPVRHFRNGLIIQSNDDFALFDSNALFDSRINLSFPFMSVLGRELDLSPLFFGVKKFDSPEAQRRAHTTTNIEHLPLIVLQYRADKPTNVTKDDVVNWERAIEHFYHHEYKNDHILPLVMSVTFVGDEIVRNGMTLFPFITVGFLIMSTFSIITVWLSAYYFGQWTRHKVSLAIVACICPLLATSTALGLLFWFGFRFGTILAVTPFLVMAIGVDDAFLMIHAWQRICVKKRELKRKVPGGLYTDTLRDRIAAMVVDCGPSISITSATNILAFVIGIFSPTPEITLFCAANAVALFVDYIYQFVFFTSILVIAADFEMKSEERRYKEANQETENRRKRIANVVRKIMKKYSSWLASEFTFILTVLVLIVYWIVSVRGALGIHASITPEKLFLSDSLVTKMNKLRNAYILPNYTAVNVFVNNVGDLSQKSQQDRVKNLIADFESMPECLGPKYTHFWMRDYEKFLETSEEDMEAQRGESGSQLFTKQEMSPFLNWPEYKHWNGFIRFNQNGTIEKFFTVIAFHGEQMVNWNFRGQMLNRWRAIADRYSDLEAWVFADDAQFLDQIETMIPATVTSSAATLACMAVICTIFMGNLFTTVVATLSILSICIGVFGFLAMWNVDLDPISMATTIMSIGFSVDFPAHASFHYYRCGVESGGKLKPEERVLNVLTAIGYPLLQCGISTVCFVLCLLFVPSYMSEVFVKTMVLVIFFGLIHGLYVIPVALCALSRIYDTIFASHKPIRSTIKKLRTSTSIKNMLSVQNDEARQKNIAKVTIQDS